MHPIIFGGFNQTLYVSYSNYFLNAPNHEYLPKKII